MIKKNQADIQLYVILGISVRTLAFGQSVHLQIIKYNKIAQHKDIDKNNKIEYNSTTQRHRQK
jgi:hypothetical protein